MHLFGYTSCSLDINQALAYANEDKENQKKPVIYQITWRSTLAKMSCYVMDKTVSAYEAEQEVLIKDGQMFNVESVEDTII